MITVEVRAYKSCRREPLGVGERLAYENSDKRQHVRVEGGNMENSIELSTGTSDVYDLH